MSLSHLKAVALVAALAIPSVFPVAAAEDDDEKDSATWGEKVRGELAKVHNYPSSALESGLQGTVHVRLEVSPNGKLATATVVQSSGSSKLDRAALKSVTKLEQLPKEGSPYEGKTIIVPMSYELADEAAEVPKKSKVEIWQNAVRRRVAQEFAYPQELANEGVEGKVKLRLWLSADGSVVGRELAEASGDERLDSEAMQLAARLEKLPALPEGHVEGSIVLPLHYKLASKR